MPPNLDVFINCPFDDDYRPIMQAVVFAVHDCGFVARSALETSDGSQVRIDKIYDLIRDCRFGIHDISMTSLDPSTDLPASTCCSSSGSSSRAAGDNLNARRLDRIVRSRQKDLLEAWNEFFG
ncbi:MAG TPA: hypothetical protein VMN78_07845 [Longimicrobiales bacterium]|nr:hypothetical protein [Longimicrobiales bacterium]